MNSLWEGVVKSLKDKPQAASSTPEVAVASQSAPSTPAVTVAPLQPQQPPSTPALSCDELLILLRNLEAAMIGNWIFFIIYYW